MPDSRQLNLFPAGRKPRRPRHPHQVPLQPPNTTGRGTENDSALSTKRNDELIFMLSQLEESKFVRLFRYLVDSRDLSGGRGKPAVPLDFPDVELQFKFAESSLGISTFTSAWLFQLAYSPSCLWKTERFEVFLRKRLEKAFFNLKTMPSTFQSRPPYSGPYDGAFTTFETASDGCDDYYLFTNVCELEESALATGAELAHRLFSEVLGIPEERHPQFGFGTPETVVKYDDRSVRRFISELLNMPSSYYLLAREGHISVVPVAQHGCFFVKPESLTNSVLFPVPATVTSSVITPSAASLAEFESLINHRSTKEQDLQAFLTSNPEFLFALDERYCEVEPHVCLFDKNGERLIPDFMVRIHDSNLWHAIELKLPHDRLLLRTNDITKASAAAARGIAELLKYRDFFSVRDNRSRVTSRFDTAAPYEPALVLVLGRGRSTERMEWSSLRSGFPTVQVVSYDYLFERAKRCAAMAHECADSDES